MKSLAERVCLRLRIINMNKAELAWQFDKEMCIRDSLLGMEDYGSYHVKLVDGGRKEEYRISDLDVTIQNVPLTSDSSKRFLADTTFLLRVPVRFGGSRLPDMQIRMKVQAAYTPVF